MPRQSSTVERIAAARETVELSSRIACDVQAGQEAMVRMDQEREDEEDAIARPKHRAEALYPAGFAPPFPPEPQ